MQIANRVPRAVIVISCLEEFYAQARAVLPQSYIDRVEKAGPIALLETRTPEEARLIIARRLEHQAASVAGPAFQFQGSSSVRRLIGWPLAIRSMMLAR